MAIDTDSEPASETPQQVVAKLAAPSLQGVARLVVIVAACAGALYLFYLSRGVLKILAIALFTATALGPVVDAVQRRRVPRAWAILLVYLACALAVVGAGALMVPSVGPQVRQLSQDAQRGIGEVRHNATVRRYDNRYHISEKIEISVIAGTLAWVAMIVLGVPFAVPLAIVVGFFDLIPMVGATLGAIIVALAALLVSPLTALLWLVYVFLYQQAENYLIQPVVYRRAVEVAPLTTVVAVLVGATLLGLLGALLAIPAAAAIQLIVQALRAERTRPSADAI